MRRVKVGLLIGLGLGLVDGSLAFLSPEARASGLMPFIIIASTIKGGVTGLLIGLVSRECSSKWLLVVIGLILGLGLSSLLALSPDPSGNYHFVEILVPGSVLGGLVGLVCNRVAPTSSQEALPS